MHLLANRISSKLEEGDYKGAVCIASSVDYLAVCNGDTLAILKEKHSSPQYQFSIPDVLLENFDSAKNISEEEVARPIKSFPNGSSGGPDGLRPQHLKDMTKLGSGEGGKQLLKVLCMFTNIVLRGYTPDFIIPFFSFSASLIAVSK